MKDNTSIQKNNISLDVALERIPKNFKDKIIISYLEIKHRYLESKYSSSSWDISGLSAGKYSETILRFLQSELTGTFIPFGKHISNFPDECRKIITLPEISGLETMRIIIPRALVFLYTLRGKRGIGHVGGDVEANEIDSVTVVRICDWIFCELIRIYHGLSLEEAQDIVDTVSIKDVPYIWEVAGKKRVLKKDLSYIQKTLLLIYSEQQKGVLSEDLFLWCEHSKFAYYKRDVLSKLHNEKFIEYDRENEIVYLSPIGVREVEDNILKLLNSIKVVHK